MSSLHPPGLRIFTSNRLEILAEILANVLKVPLFSPLKPEIIVVQSRGMERWVSMEIATHLGICANCMFPFPNTFLNDIFKILLPDVPEESPFDIDTMTFRIMKTLPECIDRQDFESVATYLKDDPQKLKLFQLSSRISNIFDQYLVFRPEMIFSWESGKENYWQAQLWNRISKEYKNMHRARLRKDLFDVIGNIRSENLQVRTHSSGVAHADGPIELPERVNVFGISYLPLFHLQALAELSHLFQVNLFCMNPCQEYWGDIVSDREMKKIKDRYVQSGHSDGEFYLEKGNSLLASMGALGRDFLDLLSNFDCELYEHFEEPEKTDVLSCIQSDILNLRDKSELHALVRDGNRGDSQTDYHGTSPFWRSIQIHSCHSPMREIEILHDNLLAMFDDDSALLPKDIIVMAPDIELYAPFIEAVFDAQADEKLRIPFSIADQSVKRESRIIDGFLSLLDLRGSRFGAAQVLGLLQISGIKEKFGLTESDAALIERWIKETHIRWGLNAEHKKKFGVPDFPENTWKAGIDRLLLGLAMRGQDKDLFAGILPYDNIEGSDGLVLGRFLEFFDRISTCIDELEKSKNLAGWHNFLHMTLKQIFSLNEESEYEVQILRRILDNLARKQALSGFDEKIDFTIVRDYLENHLENTTFGSGFISGSVTFCAMLPMRSIPFKVLCLLGMNNEAFPRDSQRLGFDYILKSPKPGDRSKRNDDRYLFLESIVSARKRLYISYVGQSIQDNARIQPSVLVSEFIDYIRDGFGVPEEQITTYHRLQPFSPEYFRPDSNLFSYSEENFLACKSLFHPKTPTPFISKKLSLPPDEWKHLDIDTLCRFFSNPSKFLLQKRLGVFLEEGFPVPEERENFSLDPLERYQLGQKLVKHRFAGGDLNTYASVQKADGTLPHGNVGDFVYNEMSREAEAFVTKLKNVVKDDHPEAVDADLDIDGFRLFGMIAALHEYGLVRFRYANIKAKDLLSAWIYHLSLGAAMGDDASHRTFLVAKNTSWEFYPVEGSRDILGELLRTYWKGISGLIHFFPESSFAYGNGVYLKKRSESAAMKTARRKWEASEFNRGESEDPYYRLCFRNTDPIDGAFQKIAETIFRPLLEHCKELKEIHV
ncbi:exodeoxyribonuclease V subunit gamma [Thermodesulfobacteriota bacterium]